MIGSVFPKTFDRNLTSVVAIAVGIFISYHGIMGVAIQVPAVVDGLEMSEGRSGFLGSLEITLVGIVAMLVGVKIDFWSKRGVALTGLALVVVGQLLSILSETFISLLLFRSLVGIGAGLIYGAACACVSGVDQGDRLFGWGMSLGQILVVIMLLVLPAMTQFGFHKGVYAFYAALSLIFGWMLLLLPNQSSTEAVEKNSKHHCSLSIIFWFFTALTLFNVAIGALWGFVEQRAEDLQMPSSQVGVALAALPFGGIVGAFLAGSLGDCLGRLKPLVISNVSCGIFCLSIGVADAPLLLILSIFGLGMFELFVVAFLVGTASVMDRVGRMATLAGGLTLVTYGLGPAVGGWLSEYLSAAEICFFAGGLCLLAAAIFLPVGLSLDKTESDVEAISDL